MGKRDGVQHCINHSSKNDNPPSPQMCVAGPRPPTNLFEILMVDVSQYSLEEQGSHDQDADDLICCVEGITLDIYDA